MPLLALALSVGLLLVLSTRFKINIFIALILTSFAAGLLNGMTLDAALKSLLKGLGDTLGGLSMVVLFGAMLGNVIETSGAVYTITNALLKGLGLGRVQIAIMIAGFLIGLPMFYTAAFFLVIPLLYALAATTRLPLLHLGVPLCAALSITHGYLPPHPAPTAVALMFHADVGRTILYGLVVAVPATIIAGPLLALFYRKIPGAPPAGLYQPREFKPEELPGLGISLFTVLFPVLIMVAGSVIILGAPANSPLAAIALFLSDPNVALFLAAMVGFYTLGLRRGRDMESLMKETSAAGATVAMILFIIAGGGAFKQVLLDGGTGEAVRQLAGRVHVPLIVLAWGAAALLRGAIGSATVSAITAAGIVLPMVPSSGVRPELVVIGIGAGSIMFSHFSDSGFWMFKEYFNLTVKHTLLTWTLMETVIGLVGLVGVLILHLVLGAP